jgi:hypothetical protein
VAVATSLKDKIKAVDDMIFRIYRDIMANYESSDNKLKITYPKIIVDVVAILTRGVDTRGNKIPLHNLEHYYQMRKSDAITTSAIASQVPISTATAASIKTIKSDDKRREESILKKRLLKMKQEESYLNISFNMQQTQ